MATLLALPVHFDDGQSVGNLWGLGLLPLMIGLGYLASWWLNQREQPRAWPFIWAGNFSGGMLDTSDTPLAVFNDGTGPTSALTQFARSTAAYLRGFQNRYGVHLYAISIQNELNFETFYNSAFYPLSSQYIAALKRVRAELDAYPDLTSIRIIGPEDLLGGDAYGMISINSTAAGGVYGWVQNVHITNCFLGLGKAKAIAIENNGGYFLTSVTINNNSIWSFKGTGTPAIQINARATSCCNNIASVIGSGTFNYFVQINSASTGIVVTGNNSGGTCTLLPVQDFTGAVPKAIANNI